MDKTWLVLEMDCVIPFSASTLPAVKRRECIDRGADDIDCLSILLSGSYGIKTYIERL
jgi:hypothetical protein